MTHKRKVTIMVGLMSAMFFASVNQTLVGTALPRIIATLGGIDYYTWVITIYLLTSTIATILVGKLSDMYGRKPFILLGIGVFMIGAFLSGFSKDIFQLISYRGIQGVGAGMIMSSTMTSVADLFSPRERGRWTGVIMAVFGVSSVLGPPLGGWLVDNMDWKWLFWIFLPLGAVAFALILSLYPKVQRRMGEKIDYLGMLFLSITIVTLLLGFSMVGNDYDWKSPEIIGLFAASFASLIILIAIEKRAENPVLPLGLFKNSIVTISYTVGFMINAAMMGALIYLPFFIQGVKGVAPTYSGYVTMPMSISMVIISSVTGALMTKTGKYKRYALIGLPIMIVALLTLSSMSSVLVAAIGMFIFGVGLGFGNPVFTISVQNAVSPNELGVATASSQMFRNLGGTVGIAIMGAIMQSSLGARLSRALPASTPDVASVDPAFASEMAGLTNPEVLLDQPRLQQLLTTVPAEIQPFVDQMIETLRTALSGSLSTVFLSAALMMTVALVLVLFLREIPLKTAREVAAEKTAAQLSSEPSPVS